MISIYVYRAAVKDSTTVAIVLHFAEKSSDPIKFKRDIRMSEKAGESHENHPSHSSNNYFSFCLYYFNKQALSFSTTYVINT